MKLKGESGLTSGSHTLRHSLAMYLDRLEKWADDDGEKLLCYDSGTFTHGCTLECFEKMQKMIVKLPL